MIGENKWYYKGAWRNVSYFMKLPISARGFVSIKNYLVENGVNGIEEFLQSGERQNRVKYPYKGKRYTAAEIVMLPECPHKSRVLFNQRVTRYNWTVERAVQTEPEERKDFQPRKVKANKFNVMEQVKQPSRADLERERIIKIMAVPVNPKKSVYLEMARMYQSQADKPSQFLEVEE